MQMSDYVIGHDLVVGRTRESSNTPCVSTYSIRPGARLTVSLSKPTGCWAVFLLHPAHHQCSEACCNFTMDLFMCTR